MVQRAYVSWQFLFFALFPNVALPLLALVWYVTRQHFVALFLLGASTIAAAWGHVALAVAGAHLLQGLVPGQALVSFYPSAWWLLTATVVKTCSTTFSARTEANLSAVVGCELRDRVARRLLQEGTLRGETTDAAYIREAIRVVERTVVTGLFGVLRAFLQLLPLGLLLIWSAPPFATVALLGLVPFAIALSWVRQIMRRHEGKALQTIASLDGQMEELIRHADLWRSYGSGNHVRSALDRRGQEARGYAAKLATLRTSVSGLNESLGAAAVVGAIAWGASHPHHTSGVALVPFFLALFWSYRPLRDLGDALTIYQACEVALNALTPWLVDPQTPAPPSPPSQGCSLTPFASHPCTLVLENFGALRHRSRWNLTIQPGSLVVLVGPNGSGKTTLIRSLLGLETTIGHLQYDGKTLAPSDVGPKARPFAWVPQDPPVLAGTLRENLELGVVQAEQAWKELQGLEEHLSWELDERLGVTGRALSGGEKARVAILRAVATGLPVLLLDEPTASLDPAAEAKIIALFQRLRGHRTLLVVTHQESMIQAADQVLRA